MTTIDEIKTEGGVMLDDNYAPRRALIVYRRWAVRVDAFFEPESVIRFVVRWLDGWFLFGLIPLYVRQMRREVPR